MSIHWPIIRRCLRRPWRVAIVDDRRPYRRLELLVAALHLAEQIERVSRSRTLGILLPTSGAFPIAALAGWFTGRVVVPLNYFLKPEELDFIVEDCGTDCVISVGPMLEFVRHQPRVAHLLRLEEVGFEGVPAPRVPAQASDDALALLLYTSGTTGRPKGVMLSHGNVRANIRQLCAWARFDERDVLLGVLPQFHCFGLTVLTLLPLTIGARVVYTARFVPHRLIQLLREHRPTAFVGIPSMYGALLHAKDATAEDFASLRYAISGAEPLPDAIVERFRERFGVTINEGYGLTETSPVTNWCRPDMWRPHSVGPPLPGVVERIVDPATGEQLGPGQEGEIRIAGPNVMRGYYHRPEESAAAFDRDGFLCTGDLGRMDADGHLYITGRIKEMLIVGGENVMPREIEEVLDRHESVAASAVIGMPDPVRGEVPVAFVEPAEGHHPDPTTLQTWCRQHLAPYKVPRRVQVVASLPRGPTGKILRRELPALLAAAS